MTEFLTTECVYFSSMCRKIRLADPLGELNLERSPRPPSWIWGRVGMGRGKKDKERGWGGKGREKGMEVTGERGGKSVRGRKRGEGGGKGKEKKGKERGAKRVKVFAPNRKIVSTPLV